MVKVQRPPKRRVKKPILRAKPLGTRGRAPKKSGDVRSKPDLGKRDLAGLTEAPPPKAEERVEERSASAAITPKDIRKLKGLGHHLDPVVQIGKEGITATLIQAVRQALATHELVKIRIGQEAPVDREAAGPELASKADAVLVQALGRTWLLYRRRLQKSKIPPLL